MSPRLIVAIVLGLCTEGRRKSFFKSEWFMVGHVTCEKNVCTFSDLFTAKQSKIRVLDIK